MPRNNSSTASAAERLAAFRGLAPDALRAMGAQDHGWEVYFPMRDDTGKVIGRRKRKANGKPYIIDGRSCKALTLKGECNGVMGPFIADGGPVLLFEGEMDACAAISHGWNGSALATPGAYLKKAVIGYLMRMLQGREVILFPDGDSPGVTWSNSIGEALSGVGCTVRMVAPRDGMDADKRLKAGEDLGEMIRCSVAWHKMEAGAPIATSTDIRETSRGGWLDDHPKRGEFDKMLEEGWPVGTTRKLFFTHDSQESLWLYALVKMGSEEAAKEVLRAACGKGVDLNRRQDRIPDIDNLKPPPGWQESHTPHEGKVCTHVESLSIEEILLGLRAELIRRMGRDRHKARTINGVTRFAQWVLERNPTLAAPVRIGQARVESELGSSSATTVKYSKLLRSEIPLFKLVPWGQGRLYDQNLGQEMRVRLDAECAKRLIANASTAREDSGFSDVAATQRRRRPASAATSRSGAGSGRKPVAAPAKPASSGHDALYLNTSNSKVSSSGSGVSDLYKEFSCDEKEPKTDSGYLVVEAASVSHASGTGGQLEESTAGGNGTTKSPEAGIETSEPEPDWVFRKAISVSPARPRKKPTGSAKEERQPAKRMEARNADPDPYEAGEPDEFVAKGRALVQHDLYPPNWDGIGYDDDVLAYNGSDEEDENESQGDTHRMPQGRQISGAEALPEIPEPVIPPKEEERMNRPASPETSWVPQRRAVGQGRNAASNPNKEMKKPDTAYSANDDWMDDDSDNLQFRWFDEYDEDGYEIPDKYDLLYGSLSR